MATSYDVKSGVTKTGIILFTSDHMEVYSGGVVVSTTLRNTSGATNSLCWLQVWSGGMASETTVSSGGHLNVVHGSAYKTTISSGGSMAIFDSGAIANITTIEDDGLVWVYSSGSANSTTISSGGRLLVSSGGTAGDTTISSGGSMVVKPYATVEYTRIKEGGLISLESGATVSITTISSGAYLVLGGKGLTANRTVVSSGGVLRVYSGGTATKTTVSSGGSFTVLQGTVSSTTIESGGTMIVFVGGTPDKTTINEGGSMIVRGGTATNTTVYQSGRIEVQSGGTVSNTTVIGGSLDLINATLPLSAVSTTLTGGTMTVRDGAKATATSAYNGKIHIGIGGTMTDTVVSGAAGSMYVYANGVASRTVVDDEARMYISGGRANEVTVSLGLLYVSSGGVAQGAAIFSEGIAHISSGGTATDAVLHRNGSMYVSNGGLVSDAVVSSGGRLEVQSGGTAVGATLLSGTSNSGGILSVSSGGTALSTVVSNGGRLLVREGLVSGAVVSSGGSFTISSGGTFTGTLTLGSKAVVSAASGGVVQFDLTKTSAGAAVFVNDISLVKGAPKYVLTVKNSQSTGKYDLAAGAASFDKTVSVVNKSTGTELGTLPVGGGTQTLGGVQYTLIETNDLLSVIVGDVAAVDKVKPTVTGVQADVTAQTNGDVTVTAVFSDDIEVAASRCKIGDGEWQDYPYGGVVVSENTTVYFQATDLGGNKSDVASIEIKNIDKVKPTITVTPSTTAPAESVTVKAQFADNVAIKTAQKRVGNDPWTEYAGAVTVTENTTVYFKAVDTAGNETTASYEVTNIGNDDPPGPGPEPPAPGGVARGDRDGNGVSDVMFVWTGEHGEGNHAHGYWMNGSDTWWSANAFGVSPDWDNLGSYDMSGDGCADAVMFGNVIVNEARGAYIGYYQDGNDADGWVTIGYLDNAENIAWQNKVGTLTGNADGRNSIVWYAPELYALGAWKDGTTEWADISHNFGGNDWTLAGCGDFSGDGRDSVLMTYNNGQLYYVIDIDGGTPQVLGSNDWRGWDLRAIGDFSGDGRDDIVLFHHDTGSMVMCADGNVDNFVSIGQLAANDWFVVGAGDYNGDAKDDLLVRQYSTGMLGYYICADQSQWVEMGRGVGMEWTVIA